MFTFLPYAQWALMIAAGLGGFNRLTVGLDQDSIPDALMGFVLVLLALVLALFLLFPHESGGKL